MPDEMPKKLINSIAIVSLLNEETVFIASPSMNKVDVIKSAVERICKSRGLKDEAGINAKVLEREKGISTTLDTGLSLPHARIKNLAYACAALVLAPQGIPEPQEPQLFIK